MIFNPKLLIRPEMKRRTPMRCWRQRLAAWSGGMLSPRRRGGAVWRSIC